MKKILATACILCLNSVTHSQTFDADASCDCSVVRGQCRAQVVKENNSIVIRSNNQMCSRITWFADENPFTTVVVNGREVEEWLGQANDPFLSIADCEVCATSNGVSAETPPAPLAATAPPDSPQPLPIIQVACPKAIDEVTGSATFSLTVTERGEVANIQLIDTTQRLIVGKATSTLARWRYEPAIVGGVPVESTTQATVSCENFPRMSAE